MKRRIAVLITALALAAAACSSGSSGGGSSAPSTSSTTTTSTLVAGTAARDVVDGRPHGIDVFETEYDDVDRNRSFPVLVHHPDGSGRFPVVVLSHGRSAAGPFMTPIARALAEAGYVVIAPTYPKTSGVGGSDTLDVQNQPADVSFLLDEVFADDRFEGLVDQDRVAVAGHSLGAITSLMIGYHSCCIDERVDAVASLAGAAVLGPEGQWFEGDEPPPLLMVHGDADELVLFPLGQNAFAQASSPKHFVTLLDGKHTPPFFNADPWFDVVTTSTVAFFDAYALEVDGGLDRLREVADVEGAAEYEEVLR